VYTQGIWRAYAGAGDQLRQVSNDRDTAGKAMSKSKPIPGSGKFIIGQLYQGSDQEFSDVNIYQVILGHLIYKFLLSKI